MMTSWNKNVLICKNKQEKKTATNQSRIEKKKPLGNLPDLIKQKSQDRKAQQHNPNQKRHRSLPWL